MTNWISVDERLPEIDPDKKGRYKNGKVSIRVLCACKQYSGGDEYEDKQVRYTYKYCPKGCKHTINREEYWI